MRLCTHWWLGLNRRTWPAMAVTPVSRAIFTRCSASSTLSVTGISTRTCLPARITCSACLKCILVGDARITASARWMPSARSLPQCETPYFLATCSVPAGLPPMSDTTSAPGMRLSASRCFWPKAPCPATQILIAFSSASCIFENDVTECRVRRRHVIEAVHFLHPVLERAAHDEPHHQLDRLRAGLAQVLEVRNLHQRLRILGQVVEEARIELAVDETGARPLQLVRHPAGAEDHDPQVLVERFDGLADRPSQHVAAVSGRHRVDHDVDGERNDGTGPLARLAEHQGERYGEAVVDLHLVDDGEIEFVEDDRLHDMRGELGMAFHRRHLARPPSLVRDRELRRAAHG